MSGIPKPAPTPSPSMEHSAQSKGRSQQRDRFGDASPWAEPAWYTVLSSPYYSDSHRQLRRFVRTYIDEKVLPYAEEWEEKGLVPLEEALNFARAGLTLQDVPQSYRPGTALPGGVSEKDWDAFHFLIIADEKGRIESGVSAGLSTASAIGLPPIIHHGTEAQKQKWLPGIITGKTSFCLGATEPSGGSDLANLRTTARKTEDGKFYVVNGHKKWITGAMEATHMTTAVRTGGSGAGGVSVLVIETSLPGFSARKIKNSGANAGRSAWVTLEDVRVPVENLVGSENRGFQVLMNTLQYAHDRVTFGQPLISNQVIRHKFAALAKDVEAHWAWLEQICYHVNIHGWNNDLASRIALAKVFGGQMLERACREAQQVLGGAGYQRGGVGWQVEQISRDLRMLVVGGGSEEIIADLAVRQELALSKRHGSSL